MHRIFFLDDERAPDLNKFRGCVVTHAKTYDAAIAIIASNEPFDEWHLDHDLGLHAIEKQGLLYTAQLDSTAKTGMDFLKYVEEHHRDKWPWGKVHCHSANPPGKANMVAFVALVERTYNNTGE